MSTRRRGEADREDRRRTLIQAADQLLRELPYLDVRVEDVARGAGVAKGTVFLYFRNKEALALAVLRMRMDVVYERLEAGAPGVSTPDQLVALMIEVHQGVPETARMIALYSAVLQHAAPPDEVLSFLNHMSERLNHLASTLATRLSLKPEQVRRMIDVTGMAIVSHAVTGRDAQLRASAPTIAQSFGLEA